MGAWGTGPYDNDTAADWFFRMTKMSAPDLIENGLQSENHYEARAAAWLLQQVGYNYVYPIRMLDDHRQKAIVRLGAILNDEEWMSKWVEPEVTRASIMAQIYDLGKDK